jgi:prolyl-tRNA editing enzyme YbaK/EbsC (Cys-tRNA(Pro) deacylase)
VSAAEKLEIPVPLAADSAPPQAGASAATRRVLDAMTRSAIPYELKILPEGPLNDEEIAAHCDCEINFIVHAMVLRGKTTKKPILLLHSAASKVNDKIIGQIVGENLQRADADFVRRLTGYPIEAVPPTAHLNRIPVLFDGTLTRFPRIWVSTGTPGAIASVPTLVLARAVSARIINLEG